MPVNNGGQAACMIEHCCCPLNTFFAQADGHPGNILVGRGGRIGLLDYGQSKQLPRDQREALAALVLEMVSADDDGGSGGGSGGIRSGDGSGGDAFDGDNSESDESPAKLHTSVADV
eukprot:scaffold71659_cov13-Tisochrysis_lutea.AAC.1